jgi:hypothetical protein
MLEPDGLQHAPLRVAVVTCDARDSSCCLVTTYNRRVEDGDAKMVSWLQRDDDAPDVEVYKA